MYTLCRVDGLRSGGLGGTAGIPAFSLSQGVYVFPAAALLLRSNCAQASLDSPRKSTQFNYSPGDHFPLLCQLLLGDTIRCRQLSPSVDAVLRVVLSSGLRFIEVSTISQSDRCGPDRWYVRGRKRSRGATLLLPGSDAQLAAYGDPSPGLHLFAARYRVVWTQLRRAGLQVNFPGRQRAVLTHFGRHRLAQSVLKVAGLPAVTSVLNHKSARSAEYYTQPHGVPYGYH